MPRVSVILNSFNQEQYLSTAVESVLSQTGRDFELIAIDNGSTDGSPDTLSRYEKDSRVRLLLFADNAAISQRFNQALAEAQGEFVSFLYSDDWYLPGKLERQLAMFAGLPRDYGVIYGPPLGHNELTGKQWRYSSVGASGDVFPDLMLRYPRGQIDMVTPLTRRECFAQHPFHEDIFAEGEGIFLRIALTHRFHFLDEPLVVLRDHGVNAGKAIRRNQEFVALTTEKLRRDPHLRDHQRPLVDHYESLVLRNYGWQGVRLDADPRWVRSCLIRAGRLWPRQALHPKTGFGLAATALPNGLRRRLNRMADSLRRAPGQAEYVEDYEGLTPTWRAD